MSKLSLGFFIKHQRDKYGVTQHQLAKEMGISQSLVCKLELGLLQPGFEIFKASKLLHSAPDLIIYKFFEVNSDLDRMISNYNAYRGKEKERVLKQILLLFPWSI